jgi:hypothetical protein
VVAVVSLIWTGTDKEIVEAPRQDALIVYPFILPGRAYPLRFFLPHNLTKEEVRRITRMLESLVMPEEPKGAE